MDQQKLELIEGDLIDKMGLGGLKSGKTRRHVNALTRLTQWLIRTFGEAFVNFECPL